MGWLVAALRERLGRAPCSMSGCPTRRRALPLASRIAAVTAGVLLSASGSGAVDIIPEDQELLASDGVALDFLGSAVSIAADTAVVGAPGEDSGAGAAYVFRFDGTAWVQQQKLVANDAVAGDLFGAAVAVSGDTIVVGAKQASTRDGSLVLQEFSGAAYVFRESFGTWFFQQKLVAPDRQQGDSFGSAVAVAGDTIVVGVPLDDTFDDRGTPAPGDDVTLEDSGSAWVFRYDGASWVEEQQILVITVIPPPPADREPDQPIREADDYFGISVSVSGDTILVGADGDDSPPLKDPPRDRVVPNHGAAYVFRFVAATWLLEQKLLDADVFDFPPAESRQRAADDRFGQAVSIDGDTALIGSWADGVGGDPRIGSGTVFRYDGVDWINEAKLAAADGASLDQLGISVAISGDYAVLGANQLDGAANRTAGVAYVFEYDGVGWPEEHKLVASDAGFGDSFGSAVSIDGGSVLVGAPGHDEPAEDAGAAYVYTVPEPSALALQISALAALVALARRTRRARGGS